MERGRAFPASRRRTDAGRHTSGRSLYIDALAHHLSRALPRRERQGQVHWFRAAPGRHLTRNVPVAAFRFGIAGPGRRLPRVLRLRLPESIVRAHRECSTPTDRGFVGAGNHAATSFRHPSRGRAESLPGPSPQAPPETSPDLAPSLPLPVPGPSVPVIGGDDSAAILESASERGLVTRLAGPVSAGFGCNDPLIRKKTASSGLRAAILPLTYSHRQ